MAASASRRRLLIGAAAGPATLLSGCVVAPHGPYHRPVVAHPGATLKGAWCRGQAGPPAVLEVALAEDVVLSATTYRAQLDRDRSALPLRLTLTLPPAPARFADADLRASDPTNAAVLGRATEMRVFRYARLPLDSWIEPDQVRPSGPVARAEPHAGPHGTARLSVSVERGFAPDRIALEGIQLERPGQTHVLPTIELARPASTRNHSDYRSAAMQAQVQERAAACRRETPKHACENIIDHAQYSFETDLPVAQVRGRWYRFDGRADEPIRGDLEIVMRQAGRWRLQPPRLTVADAASGERRTQDFQELVLFTNDRVPLATPLFQGPVAGSGVAQLSIEMLLPPGVGDFDLRLPALLLAGQRIEVPAIRFEKRYVGGGIEPLNC